MPIRYVDHAHLRYHSASKFNLTDKSTRPHTKQPRTVRCLLEKLDVRYVRTQVRTRSRTESYVSTILHSIPFASVHKIPRQCSLQPAEKSQELETFALCMTNFSIRMMVVPRGGNRRSYTPLSDITNVPHVSRQARTHITLRIISGCR